MQNFLQIFLQNLTKRQKIEHVNSNAKNKSYGRFPRQYRLTDFGFQIGMRLYGSRKCGNEIFRTGIRLASISAKKSQ